jgi:hypothetical protein
LALLAVGLLACAQSPAADGPPASGPWVWSGDADGLHCLSECELHDLFRRATIHQMPCGFFPGKVIYFTNTPANKLIKRLSDNHWFGKIFEEDGAFTNQFKHVVALHSCLKVEGSFQDGQPCYVCEYPRLTPMFGPMRDEYREVAPGIFLGAMYRHSPKCKFLGYNVLRACDSACEKVVVQKEAIPAPKSGSGTKGESAK